MDPRHRLDTDSVVHVQAQNRAWWTRNTMSYDWNDAIGHAKFSLHWFDDIDRRFIEASRLFASHRRPFDRLIPFEQLQGRRVLEVGCGMGFHTELLVRAGADVTAVDLSPTSVQATRTRLKLRQLTAEIRQADCEQLPFGSATFDFVWSWGVIHHSSRTGRAVREIARVLRPEGEARVMVYNRRGLGIQLSALRDQLLHGGALRRSWEESLYASGDGYSARYYTQEQFEDLFRTFFADVSSEICGQEADVVPLPARLRRTILRLVPDGYLRKSQSRRGAFIFLRASAVE